MSFVSDESFNAADEPSLNSLQDPNPSAKVHSFVSSPAAQEA